MTFKGAFQSGELYNYNLASGECANVERTIDQGGFTTCDPVISLEAHNDSGLVGTVMLAPQGVEIHEYVLENFEQNYFFKKTQ